jgi:hypothetical protein
MDNDDVKVLKEYSRENDIINNLKAKLENLLKAEQQISKDRFEKQKNEYVNILDNIRPHFAELEKIIRNNIVTLEKDIAHIKTKIDPIENSILQEKRLYKVGAISKRNYKENLKPIEKELKVFQLEYDSKKKRLNLFKREIEKKNKISKPVFKMPEMPEMPEMPKIKIPEIPKSDFKNDFWSGAKYIVLIIAIIIAIPLLVFALKVGGVLALPLVGIFVLIIFIASFGRVINFFKERW